MMIERVWIVGIWHSGTTPNVVWSLAGVYTNHDSALIDAKRHEAPDVFIASIKVNRFFGPPVESFDDIEWPNGAPEMAMEG